MPSIDEWGDRFEKRPGMTALRAAIGATFIVLIIVAIVGLATTGSVFFRGAAAKHTIKPRLQEQVYTPENARAQIAFFHDQCQGVNRALATIKNNEARLAADQQAARFAKDPIRQQQAVQSLVGDEQDVTGAKNNLATIVADYNSRSRQSTANVFKDSGLPDQITVPADVDQMSDINCG